MRFRVWVRMLVLLALVVPPALFAGAATASGSTATQRYLVVARSGADYDALRAKAVAEGARLVMDLRPLKTFVVMASASAKASLLSDSRTYRVAADHIEQIAAPPEGGRILKPGTLHRRTVRVAGPVARPNGGGFTPDPAFSNKGMLTDYHRIGLPKAWNTTTGSSAVTVGVADTGLDFTHVELASKVVGVVDFTQTDPVPLCKYFFGQSDGDLAKQFGGPKNTDWNGHGSWIGGNIAGAANGVGTNGIAPGVRLVSLKISQWCGSAFDSTILGAFVYAAQHGVDIVSISFGGYLDRTDPSQDTIWNEYVDAVTYAHDQGTTIVAAAGNEHTRVGTDGLVLSHGTLTTPGGIFFDAFGQYEVPGGIPGVVDVASLGTVTKGASATCAPGTIGEADGNATCKPASDTHQPIAAGSVNQLAYYSNYGPRIDVAAPGGAREFNLPRADRGGTPGFPYTSTDGLRVWENFSITSNWAQEIPCFFIAGGGFPAGQCYTAIQGTSMATPHVSAVLALLLSAHPELIGDVDGAIAALKAGTTHPNNFTPGLSDTDTTAGDLTGIACPTAYCHLGGAAISNAEAYGAGLVNAFRVVG